MICIATPTRDSVDAGFTQDLLGLVKQSPDTQWLVVKGTYINNLRTRLVQLAQEAGASHILFIDSDMRFPADTIERLLARNKDIIGANCRQRTQDKMTARIGDKDVSSKGQKGLQKVDTLGFGVTLIRLEVFETSVAELGTSGFRGPWFAMPWAGKEFHGEDVYFCDLARKAGYEIWIDHDLSQEVKHVGSIEL